jgi:hypothetical protein
MEPSSLPDWIILLNSSLFVWGMATLEIMVSDSVVNDVSDLSIVYKQFVFLQSENKCNHHTLCGCFFLKLLLSQNDRSTFFLDQVTFTIVLDEYDSLLLLVE